MQQDTAQNTGGDGARTGVTSENSSVLAGERAGQGAEGDDFEELLNGEENNASENSQIADDSTYTVVVELQATNMRRFGYHFSRKMDAKRRAHELGHLGLLVQPVQFSGDFSHGIPILFPAFIFDTMRASHQKHAHLSAVMVQRILDENQQLILAVIENQQASQSNDCSQYLAKLQRNLMMLGSVGDTQVNSAAGWCPRLRRQCCERPPCHLYFCAYPAPGALAGCCCKKSLSFAASPSANSVGRAMAFGRMEFCVARMIPGHVWARRVFGFWWPV